MILKLARALAAALLGLLVILVLLLSPVAYTELACRPAGEPEPYTAILPPEHHRPESRTYLTYPEWHIVHAYDDYAEVIRDGDPQDYGYLQGIAGFWSTLCDVAKGSGAHGGFPGATKSMVYVIGVSFTAELLAKAAYEETLGRIATWIRGPEHSPLDTLSARQARDYATFLQQVPWYRWDFTGAAAELHAAATDAFRDRERRWALGLEYRGKAAYARAIAAAVASTGNDALRLRMIVDRPPAPDDRLRIITTRPEGIEIETIRYRALTHLLQDLATQGINVIEIAGNDDIMMTVISDAETLDGAQTAMQRQGYGDYRHLIGLNVRDLTETLRRYDAAGIRVEHIHDY